MFICPSDFIPLILLGSKYTDRQIVENSINHYHRALLKHNSPHMHITKSGSYTRGLRTLQDRDSFSQDTVVVPRVRIRHGMSIQTHSILSDLCIPHSVFTITFVMTVLYLHFIKQVSINDLELQWHISGKTIRRWKKLYAAHAREWKLALQKLKKENDDLTSLNFSTPPPPFFFYCSFRPPFPCTYCIHLILSDDPLHPPDLEP